MLRSDTKKSKIGDAELIINPDGSVYHLGLKPGDIAKTIIIVGDPERVQNITSRFDSVDFRVSNREFVIETGVLNNTPISVVSSGIGVDNIDILINEIDALFNIDFETRLPNQTPISLTFVRIGTTGALDENIEPGTFIASKYALGFDAVPFHYSCKFDSEELALMTEAKSHIDWEEQFPHLYGVKCSFELMDKIGFDMIQGITCTANGFYGPQGRSLRVPLSRDNRINQLSDFHFKEYRVTNLEMECAGLYALASMMGHEVLTCCVALANRKKNTFSNSPSSHVDALIERVLERLTPSL